MEKNKELQTKLVFADVFKIKTNTEFNIDGTLTVTPIGWKEGDVKLTTPTGRKPPKIYGKMEYLLSGKAVFCPSVKTEQPRYTDIYNDGAYLKVKETSRDYIFKIQASKGHFNSKEFAKPVLGSFKNAKDWIDNEIKLRENHGSKSHLLQGR